MAIGGSLKRPSTDVKSEQLVPDPSIRGACFVVTSDSHPHVLPMYAPVRALAPPPTHRLLDGQVNQIDTTLRTDYGLVGRYRMRLNHSSESEAETSAATAAAAENRALISMSFFSSTSRALRDS